jgi:hypothetical protein
MVSSLEHLNNHPSVSLQRTGLVSRALCLEKASSPNWESFAIIPPTFELRKRFFFFFFKKKNLLFHLASVQKKKKESTL